MKLHEEFKLFENMWEQSLKEDNMADLKRGIRTEIAEYEAEKAADPANAWDWDEKIAAAKAELAELDRKYPTAAKARKQELAAKKAALEAENKETAKRIDRLLKYFTFLGLGDIFGRPRCINTKDGEFKISFPRQLSQEAILEAEQLCTVSGIPVKYNAQEQMFIVDTTSIDLHKNTLDIRIDRADIIKRLSNNNLKEEYDMATKITKSELKQMIREALREELSSGSVLKEAASTMDWDDLIVAADDLLEQLAKATGNADYDDGDGYWEEEDVTWCMRYLYYSDKLKNTKKLEKLCGQYSNKLPKVSFYFVEREDDFEPISEIGYTAEC